FSAVGSLKNRSATKRTSGPPRRSNIVRVRWGWVGAAWLERIVLAGWAGARVAERIVEDDEPAERGAKDDRTLDPENVAESPQVVGPLVEVPPFRCPGLAAAVSPVVVVHDLGDLSQRRITRLEGCVVESGAAVHDDDRGPLPHGHSVRYELGTVDVDEEPHVTDGNEHDESRLTG